MLAFFYGVCALFGITIQVLRCRCIYHLLLLHSGTQVLYRGRVEACCSYAERRAAMRVVEYRRVSHACDRLPIDFENLKHVAW